MAWVMSSRRTDRPVCYTFFIGEMPVAEIRFITSRAVLWTGYDGQRTEHENMSAAMKEMHRRLNAPAPEGNKVGERM